jgi:nitrogen fixation/metabolism regulation signal transduction histidine kinase
LDIYFKKRKWKRYIFLAAVLIGIGSILYTNKLVKEVSNEERIKVERWAEATYLLATKNDLGNDVQHYLNKVITTNTTIPLIIVDKNDSIYANRNIKYNEKNKKKVLRQELKKMKANQSPIVIPLGNDEEQYLYYKESSLQTKLKYYPIFQLVVIIIFIIIAYIAFSSARKTEQNLVWVGMAKETAHQLGTPISSLLAWMELLKEENVSPAIMSELEKDMNRLERITERFSKVGSKPELYPENIYNQLLNTISYLQTRISKKITFEYNFSERDELYIPLSSSLFGWVIENIVRNSVDAIENKHGIIRFHVEKTEKEVLIDITDNGKGISKSKQKTIFQPGFTTKKRGWGLGLSLSKRIIENYHNGKIFIKNSEPNKATTFRIVLKKYDSHE